VNDTILTAMGRNSEQAASVLDYKGNAVVESSNIVKVVAAFVAGVVVALGSALIYVRVSDTPHVIPASQVAGTASAGPTELPDASPDVTPPQETTPPAQKPELKPIVPERPIVKPVTKPIIPPRRTYVNAAPTKPLRKPIQIAQNSARPVLQMPAATPAVHEASPAPSTVEDVQPVSQDQPNSYAQPTADPAPAAVPQSPQPHVVTLPEGTILAVRVGETLSTDHNYTGDTFRATLMSPVIQDGFIIADRGSKVLGRIVNAQSAGHMSNVAGLSLALTELNTTDGQRIAVETTIYDQKGNSNVGQDVAKIAGGAALGAIIGGVAGGGKGAGIGAGVGGAAGTGAVLLTRGKPAVVDSETQITFRLASPLTITEKLN
jgi:hypothetical protein